MTYFMFCEGERRISKQDDLNWCVQHKELTGKDSKNPGAIRWRNVSYHRTLAQAFKALAWEIADATEAQTVRDYIEELDRICARMERVVLDAVGESSHGIHARSTDR